MNQPDPPVQAGQSGPASTEFTRCDDCNAVWSGRGGVCPICGKEGQPEATGDEQPADQPTEAQSRVRYYEQKQSAQPLEPAPRYDEVWAAANPDQPPLETAERKFWARDERGRMYWVGEDGIELLTPEYVNALEAENAALRAEVERLRDDLNTLSLRHAEDEARIRDLEGRPNQ